MKTKKPYVKPRLMILSKPADVTGTINGSMIDEAGVVQTAYMGTVQFHCGGSAQFTTVSVSTSQTTVCTTGVILAGSAPS